MILNIDGTHTKNNNASLKGLQAIVGGLVQPLPLAYTPSNGGINALIMLVNEEGLIYGLKHNIVASMLVGTHIVGNVAIVAPVDTGDEIDWRALNNDEYNDIALSIDLILKAIQE